MMILFEGTLRSRTIPSEENQAVVDLSLGISPRLVFRRFSALGLDLKKISLLRLILNFLVSWDLIWKK